jgi:hypothetical protein
MSSALPFTGLRRCFFGVGSESDISYTYPVLPKGVPGASLGWSQRCGRERWGLCECDDDTSGKCGAAVVHKPAITQSQRWICISHSPDLRCEDILSIAHIGLQCAMRRLSKGLRRLPPNLGCFREPSVVDQIFASPPQLQLAGYQRSTHISIPQASAITSIF